MRALATLIVQTIRKVDIATRYREEEIAIIMPHTTGESAIVQAERLREKVAAPWMPHLKTILSGLPSPLVSPH